MIQNSISSNLIGHNQTTINKQELPQDSRNFNLTAQVQDVLSPINNSLKKTKMGEVTLNNFNNQSEVIFAKKPEEVTKKEISRAMTKGANSSEYWLANLAKWIQQRNKIKGKS